MRVSRVLPVLAATAAVLVASAAAGGARPGDGAAQNQPGAGGPAAMTAQDLPPMVLLFASAGTRQISELRVEVCTLADSPDPRRTAFRVDVKTPGEPVDATCLNVPVPAPPKAADIPAHTGPDREPTTAADRDYGAVTVAAVHLTQVKLSVCPAIGTIQAVLGPEPEPGDDCQNIPVTR